MALLDSAPLTDLQVAILDCDRTLQRILYSSRELVPKPGHTAILDQLLIRLGALADAWLKARSLEHLEFLQRRLRVLWFQARGHAEGWRLKLPGGHDDGCEHVTDFAHGPGDPAFEINHRARAALWYRYAQRPPPPWV